MKTRRPTKTEAIRDFFEAQPHAWIDGRRLESIGGCYAWRSRVSDARRQFGMTIENRERRIQQDGKVFTISEYRFIPSVPAWELQP